MKPAWSAQPAAIDPGVALVFGRTGTVPVRFPAEGSGAAAALLQEGQEP